MEFNDAEYNALKTVEECTELTLALVQHETKPHKVPEQDIVDELGDAILRCHILAEQLGVDRVQKRINQKINQIMTKYKTRSNDKKTISSHKR